MINNVNTVSVRFDGNNKAYTFKTTLDNLTIGDKVVVETVRGLELGTVSSEIAFDVQNNDYSPIVRLASENDLDHYEINIAKAKQDRSVVEKAIKDERLSMDVVGCEYTLDQSKLVVTYVAEKRVDFRNLLKVLTNVFPCRIELKQIGPREKAKMVGGIGVCGQRLCCSETNLEFEMVTISMAKNQLLSLNIGKLSGQCGKLKCCLRFENDYYTDARQGLPEVNSKIEFDGKQYRVQEFNVVTRTLTLVKAEEIRVITFNDYKEAKG